MDDCWIWPRTVVDHSGHGMLRGRSAHCIIFEAVCGPIPDGCQLHHECENPLCVNPFHLTPKSPRDHVIEHERTLAGIRFRQTHCVHGHAFDAANTYIDKKGQRHCRRCNRERQKRYRKNTLKPTPPKEA